MEKFARKCDCCGKGMNEGYHDSDNSYCSDRCLIWGNSDDGIGSNPDNLQYDMDCWELDCEKYPDSCYYTEWEEVDKDEYFTAEGDLHPECLKNQ